CLPSTTLYRSLGPGTNTAEGDELDASTASDFSGTMYSSTTASVTASTLTVGVSVALTPYTTYYLRAGAINYNNVVNFGTSQSTRTLAGAAPRSAERRVGKVWSARVSSRTVNNKLS